MEGYAWALKLTTYGSLIRVQNDTPIKWDIYKTNKPQQIKKFSPVF